MIVFIFSGMTVNAANGTEYQNTTWQLDLNNKSIEDNVSNNIQKCRNENYLIYELPSSGTTQDIVLNGNQIELTYKNAAKRKDGTDASDVKIIISNVEIKDYNATKANSVGVKYIHLYSKLDNGLYSNLMDANYNLFDSEMSTNLGLKEVYSGVRYDVSIEIVNAISNETYAFSARDMDTPNQNGSFSGYWYEGIDLVSGFNMDSLIIRRLYDKH